MRGDLRRSRTPPPLLFEPLDDLLPPRTRCLHVLTRVAFDLRLSVCPALDLVAEFLQPYRKLRTVHRRRELLHFVKLLRLQRARLPLGRLRDIEDHRVPVQLRRGVPIDGPAAVVLELGHRSRARRLRRSVAVDPRLGTLFHLVESHAHALPVRIADPVIAANQGRDRY